MNKIIAIRSLLCEDHAYHMPPNVLCITWMTGKRCNFDCSYCSPHFHDFVSPFIDTDTAYQFVDSMFAFAEKNNKRIKWNFSGGEPFIDPGLMPLVKKLAGSKYTEQLDVTTNGSLPYKTYVEAYQYFKGITFSIHLERPVDETWATIEKLKQLKQTVTGHITVNLMALPGSMSLVENILQELTAAGIPAIVRKITPLSITEEMIPFVNVEKTRKSVQLEDVTKQQTKKQTWTMYSDQKRASRMTEYYSAKEEEYLAKVNQRPIWQNAGVWTKDSYTELHTDTLIASDNNDFLGWTCYAGVDNLYIDFDGTIYRGQCLSGGEIGHIKENTTFLTEPTVCEKQWCLCNTEIAIRKVSAPEQLSMINQN